MRESIEAYNLGPVAELSVSMSRKAPSLTSGSSIDTDAKLRD